jgi:hypothetical protein
MAYGRSAKQYLWCRCRCPPLYPTPLSDPATDSEYCEHEPPTFVPPASYSFALSACWGGG